MDLSIIVVSYNTKDLLKNCLDSVIKNTQGVEYEIIVVDNASADDSVEMLKTAFPRVRLIFNKENLGFSRANNLGLKIAQGENILLLNSDTIILDDAIAKVLKFVRSNNSAGVVGCKVLNSDKTLQFSCYHFPSFITELLFFTKDIIKNFDDPFHYYGFMKYWDHNTIREVDCIAGSFLWVKREVFDKVGYLDEKLFLYYEDTEFCYRVKKMSYYRIYYYPEARIIHFGGMSVGKNTFNSIKYSYTSSKYYLYKRYNEMVVRIFSILCKLIWYVEIVIFSVLKFNSKFKRKLEMLRIMNSL